MTKKVPKKFGKSIDWTVTTDKKQINSLNKNIRTIAQQLDENPLPDKDQLNPKKKQ
ncbi:hypothetical protein LEAN103870_12890 [Legionella anisa]|uniref:hypothetical protein n=1 Tax=Legionella anisa TaxID=28082 RepID=UPI000348D55B|nr:hypothetical protein [Legionella anisa]KTC68989.1 hypothetical protein Lani_2875 [Legionella anisa]MBN5937041.1 hypothetical protein [Legionella anisa]MCW8424895.1 hypothetical protein [Legionella anisa]MCW8445985.1 hypothetical protein [Legionella anisa]UAK80118.1 hypothetical protein K8O89_03285 [Legionella anisa]